MDAGFGMRDLIAQAVCMGIPVIVAVPERNLRGWREFAGELSVELNSSGGVDEWLRRCLPRGATEAGMP